MKTIAQFFNPFGGYFACITDRLAKYFKLPKFYFANDLSFVT